jgi:apolipoprotein N-acyltransferase
VKFQPDAIVWPETMYRDPLLIKSPGLTDQDMTRVAPYIPPYAWKSTHVPDLLHSLSRQAGAAMIIGIDTFVADQSGLKHYNSAVLSDPTPGMAELPRYDKIHRVAFGEYVPLRNILPFLQNFVPYGSGFGIDPGEEPVAFQCKKWRLAPLICFEDTVPHLVRGIVSQLDYRDIGGKPIDCLVNLTNDGWFDGSSGLDQHLISALFRCVECRKPMVRAVNTGISAVINGDGAVIEPEVYLDADNKGRNSMRDPKTGRWHRQLNEVIVDSVPLDNRTSLYVRYGDWFAECCGCALFLVVLLSMAPARWFVRRAPAMP